MPPTAVEMIGDALAIFIDEDHGLASGLKSEAVTMRAVITSHLMTLRHSSVVPAAVGAKKKGGVKAKKKGGVKAKKNGGGKAKPKPIPPPVAPLPRPAITAELLKNKLLPTLMEKASLSSKAAMLNPLGLGHVLQTSAAVLCNSVASYEHVLGEFPVDHLTEQFAEEDGACKYGDESGVQNMGMCMHRRAKKTCFALTEFVQKYYVDGNQITDRAAGLIVGGERLDIEKKHGMWGRVGGMPWSNNPATTVDRAKTRLYTCLGQVQPQTTATEKKVSKRNTAALTLAVMLVKRSNPYIGIKKRSRTNGVAKDSPQWSSLTSKGENGVKKTLKNMPLLRGHSSNSPHLCGTYAWRMGDSCVPEELHGSMNTAKQTVQKGSMFAAGAEVGTTWQQVLRKAGAWKHSAANCKVRRFKQMRGNDYDKFREVLKCGVGVFPESGEYAEWRPLMEEKCLLEQYFAEALRVWDARTLLGWSEADMIK